MMLQIYTEAIFSGWINPLIRWTILFKTTLLYHKLPIIDKFAMACNLVSSILFYQLCKIFPVDKVTRFIG
jgi:hypothetical protein